ncbi:MAG: type I-C CRISPR-associated protein Cas8c/Csd1 [Xanthomonadaceae bacterium]|jgi:CRISPR-associated protein Csd1|nr:type I-C CRISPR-associated protein Cas8c/Csd1 [Xanthomonadaceae bacterium]
MILQSLDRYYHRVSARPDTRIAQYGYSTEKISYAILLTPDGEIADVHDIRDTSGKKPMPRMLNVPSSGGKRASGIKPNFLWDKTSYVLGVSAGSKRAEQEHAAFKTWHLALLADQEDIGLNALRLFLQQWTPERFHASEMFSDDMLDANFVFRLDGIPEYLHQRPAAQALRARLRENDGEAEADPHAISNMCLVTGEIAPPARLHPAIKGVYGAQSSGASIVTFNLDAFSSYGKNQGENAPVSEKVAFTYVTVLNHLLRRDENNRQYLRIGDASVVFWAEADTSAEAEAAESCFADLLDPKSDDDQESEKIRRVLTDIASGRPLREIDPELDENTRMYILGLAPNASRLSVRFWETDTFGELARRILRHAQDIHIEPDPWRTLPPVWRLTLAAAPSRDGRAKADDVPPQLAGELMRAILSGAHYPRHLLTLLIMRMRSDGDISGTRVALCKGVLTRDQRLGVKTHSDEEIPVSLDKQSNNPGYRLGRLFSLLENLQYHALGNINATIRDRYYGAASATPASIFPMLLRNAQNHLGKLRKEKSGLAFVLEKEIREIIDGLPEQFPRSLRLEDQGRFAIGYYHQTQARFAKSKNDDTTDTTEPTQQGASA